MLASARWPARERALIARPRIALYRQIVFSTMLRLLYPECLCHSRRPSLRIARMFLFLSLVAAARLWEIDPATGEMTAIGNYNESGSDIGSSGDVVAIYDFGIVATVNVEGEDDDHLARIDPVTWRATVIGDTGYDRIFGLGFWGGHIYGFTDNMEFVAIDPDTGQVVQMSLGSIEWWGAGVTTIAPIID